MSSNEFASAVDNNPDLKTRAQRLAVDSIAILRNFDPVALVIAIAALIVIAGALDIAPLWALVLAAMTYVGTTLLRPHSAPIEPIPPPPPGLEAYALSQDSSARMLTLTKEVADPAVRRQVRAVQAKFTKMLGVMDVDQKFTSTGDYYAILVHPFERLLGEYVRLSSRNIPGADHQLRHFEREVVPRTEAVAEAFYQDYHQSDVIDLAALMEIHSLNLDSLSPDEIDLDDDTADQSVDDDAVSDSEAQR